MNGIEYNCLLLRDSGGMDAVMIPFGDRAQIFDDSSRVRASLTHRAFASKDTSSPRVSAVIFQNGVRFNMDFVNWLTRSKTSHLRNAESAVSVTETAMILATAAGMCGSAQTTAVDPLFNAA